MPIELADESAFELRTLHASNGLNIKALANGCIYAIDCNGILINQVLSSPLAGGVHRLFLRIHDGDTVHFAEIIGPRAQSEFASSADRFVWSGVWKALRYRCVCWLHPSGGAWFFHLEIQNESSTPLRCDSVFVQDLGLAALAHVRRNELYNSQYVDHVALQHPELGYLLMSRQNLPQPGETHPWLLLGCFPRGLGYLTDGLEFFGLAHKDARIPDALSRKLIGDSVRQSEVAYTSIQSSEMMLLPSLSQALTFFAHFVADHPEPTSPADADRLHDVQRMRLDLSAALTVPGNFVPARSTRSVVQTCELFSADDLNNRDLARLFPIERRHEESHSGELHSFFYGEDARHVLLKAKELAASRPHGHIMRAGRGFMPDAELMSCACYAAGVFASQLALGNTTMGKLLSGIRDPLNVVNSNGLRMFVRHDANSAWRLLTVPSAFEMALDHCRWHYKRGDNLLTITSRASEEQPVFAFEIEVKGPPLEVLICGEIAAGPAEYESSPQLSIDHSGGRISIRPDPRSLLGQKQPQISFEVVVSDAGSVDAIEAMGGDELLFADGQSRRLPYFAIQTQPTRSFALRFAGSFTDSRVEEDDSHLGQTKCSFWSRITTRPQLTANGNEPASQILDALTWFARDSVVHLSTPRGLEQANGGAWGVRDVCQGSVEFLLSYDNCDLVAGIIRRIFAQQYHRRWDWPQWFMFPPFQEIQSRHCHGDNLIWPLKALCDYLEHANDASILHERLPYIDEETFQRTDESESLLKHCDRLLQRMREQFLPGVALPRYGEGDWDDSLQPADPLLRERMVSSWTSALMYQTLRRYAAALVHFGETARGASVASMADEIETDFQRFLMPDNIVAGFAVFGAQSRPVEYLLHPSDTRTGIRYRLIPMTRGIISGIFSPAQAAAHLELIRQHLLFPDGARLMDRPTTYHGGTERTFRRSESAAFFGREIGLQYVHAHLRYAEALAVMGRAEELLRALLVVNPIAVTEVVPNARARQRNCYFSSSDAAFSDRYQASRDYEKLRHGEVPVDGGWRIYSSGPGIYTSLVIRHLFGLRRRFDSIELDPVLPRELHGATFELTEQGRRVRYEFPAAKGGDSSQTVSINGVAPTFARSSNAHRTGGVRIRTRDFEPLLIADPNIVRIEV